MVFDGDYLREHITLGYGVTVHSAQGVTADTAHAVIGESATRAMAYVAMSRGRDTNQAYIYTRVSGEADHEHAHPVAGGEVHELRRGTKYSAAHYLRAIAANDQRPHTMHVEAPNRLTVNSCPTLSGSSWAARINAAPPAAEHSANTPPRRATSAPPTNAWPPPRTGPPNAAADSMSMGSNCRSG